MNHPLNQTRFSPVLVVAARPRRELRRVRFERDSDQLGKVRFAYFRADGVEAKIESRDGDPDGATLFIDTSAALERSFGAVPFGYAILQALGVEDPRIVWRNPELARSDPSDRHASTLPAIDATPGDARPALAALAVSDSHH